MKTNQLALTALATLLAVLLLVGCRAVVAPSTAPPQDASDAGVVPIANALRNATFTGIVPDQPVTLADGIAYYEEDGHGTPFVQLIDSLTSAGDLDGDGLQDAAGLLVDYTTGSADFVYLAALLSTQSGPAEAVLVGDRTPVKALTVADGQVIVDFVGPGPRDAACCPAWNVRKVYGVADGRLVERSSEELGEVTLADLDGTAWRLVDMGEEQPPLLPDTEVSLRFDDGQISGSAGCNDYTGAVSATEDLPQSFAVGPLAATAGICADAISNQEATYLDLLGKAVAWRYAFGQLAITYKLDGDVFGELLFAPRTSGVLPDAVVAQLDKFVQAQVYSEGADPQTHTPGLILLVDTPDGRYLQAAGVASLEEGTPMQAGDRLEIGSNSKSFTIVLLLQLQEEGVLALDDPLSAWLPDWAARLPNGEQMTLRQLAQHTAGIWDYGDPIIGAAANDPAQLEQGYSPAELVQYAIDNGMPDFAPGAEGMWKYSNTGYILLGMILEKATGQSLGELYQARIFDPLGLETAALIAGVPATGEITDGYWWIDKETINNTTHWNVSQGWAAGGIAMTAAELLTYAKALAAGELFQNPDTLTEMLTFNPNGMNGLMPYGLGLLDFNKVGAPGSWGHEGQTAGFQSLWYTNPDTGVTVVGLTNSAAYSAFSFLDIAGILADAESAEGQ